MLQWRNLRSHERGFSRDAFENEAPRSSNRLIGEYSTSGEAVRASLIQNLSDPLSLVIQGSDLFVTNGGSGTVGEYSIAGDTINESLVSGLNLPSEIAASGIDLFISDSNAGAVWDYNLSSGDLNKKFITGLGQTSGIAVNAIPKPTTVPLMLVGITMLGNAFAAMRLRRSARRSRLRFGD